MKMNENNLETDELTILWTTVDSAETARRLSASLLQNRLAACVQIDSPVESHYSWEGQLKVEKEYRLIIKSRASLTAALTEHLEKHHPYDEPQILVTPVTAAAAGYTRWVNDQTR
ncbi:divalent-cation tolerance protein CutA [Allorhodopirellula solitaria]|uniref:Divalent-cation tolerance protein CutA n=1 Tax=Allorhodopirellula solitaria TaxID=2527987 RepID=A0A5C5XUC9_9BACT|nr:divalent-cation tolerance protein CutA [Allorhodopirellula solitaria]TWT65993.1 Divalent-cation tolerance protein CutA [Allorhodopirellula solitaria]